MLTGVRSSIVLDEPVAPEVLKHFTESGDRVVTVTELLDGKTRIESFISVEPCNNLGARLRQMAGFQRAELDELRRAVSLSHR